jgi:hypothetical protein
VFEAGWVHNNVTVGLLILPVFVFVTFVGSCSVSANPYNADSVWVTTCYVDEVVRHVFAAESDDIEPKVWFAGDR